MFLCCVVPCFAWLLLKGEGMNRTLLKYDLSKVIVCYLLALSLWTAYVLIPATPFRPWDPGAIVIGMLMGAIVAAMIFVDTDGTEVWIVTRGLTRRQLFNNRFGLGIVLILMAGMVSLGTTVLGLRPLLHVWNSAELSIVRWFELNLTATFLLSASTGFCAQLFLFVLTRLTRGARRTESRGHADADTVSGLGVIVFVATSFTFAAVVRLDGGTPDWGPTVVVVFSLVMSVLTAIAARHGYQVFDVE